MCLALGLESKGTERYRRTCNIVERSSEWLTYMHEPKWGGQGITIPDAELQALQASVAEVQTENGTHAEDTSASKVEKGHDLRNDHQKERVIASGCRIPERSAASRAATPLDYSRFERVVREAGVETPRTSQRPCAGSEDDDDDEYNNFVDAEPAPFLSDSSSGADDVDSERYDVDDYNAATSSVFGARDCSTAGLQLVSVADTELQTVPAGTVADPDAGRGHTFGGPGSTDSIAYPEAQVREMEKVHKGKAVGRTARLVRLWERHATHTRSGRPDAVGHPVPSIRTGLAKLHQELMELTQEEVETGTTMSQLPPVAAGAFSMRNTGVPKHAMPNIDDDNRPVFRRATATAVFDDDKTDDIETLMGMWRQGWPAPGRRKRQCFLQQEGPGSCQDCGFYAELEFEEELQPFLCPDCIEAGAAPPDQEDASSEFDASGADYQLDSELLTEEEYSAAMYSAAVRAEHEALARDVVGDTGVASERTLEKGRGISVAKLLSEQQLREESAILPRVESCWP